MTSHKEQPAVDTSAEKLLALADELRSVVDEGDDLGENATNPTTIYLRRVLERVEAALRSLAAHPAEPAGMELETTAEERAYWQAEAGGGVARLVRDFDRMRARAEKAEAELAVMTISNTSHAKELAALKQPVSDEEAQEMIKALNGCRVGARTMAVSVIRRLVRERDALFTQLRDAQARGKGMEEALRWVSDQYDNQDIGHKDFRVDAAVRARAALSRPEGSAST